MVTTVRPPNREELAAQLRARTRLFGALLVAAVVTVFVPLPVRLAGGLFGLAAVVVGMRLLFSLAAWRRAGGQASGFIGVSVGLGLASVLVVVNLVQAALYPSVRDLERCLSTASTIAAKDRCADQYSPRLGPAASTVDR